LEKAWVGFGAAKRLENDEDMKLYASIIQRLEKELKIEVNDFPELDFVHVILKKRIQRKRKRKTETKKRTQNWQSLIHGLMKRYKKQRKTKTIIEKLTLTACNHKRKNIANTYHLS